MTATQWTVPLESREWVGPIVVTVTVDGTPVEVDPSAIKFAVVPEGSRPQPDEWLPPVVEPGGTALGVQAVPVDTYQKLGIWVQITDSPEIPVLAPSSVGTIIRN